MGLGQYRVPGGGGGGGGRVVTVSTSPQVMTIAIMLYFYKQ